MSNEEFESQRSRLGCAVAGLLLLVVILLALPLFLGPQEVGRPMTIRFTLKQVGLSLHNYREEHGAWPENVRSTQTDELLLSWRVGSLPFLESQLRPDPTQSWDSDANSFLLADENRWETFYSNPPSGMETRTRILRVEPTDGGWNGYGPVLMVEGQPAMCVAVTDHFMVPWTQPKDLTVWKTVVLLKSDDVLCVLLEDGSVVKAPVNWKVSQP